MTIKKLAFTPTINKESTTYSAENTYRDCDKIRFRSGYPEKIGGWVRFNGATFDGTCRALTAWRTVLGRELLGTGTHLRYYIEANGAFNDITPVRRTVTLTNPFKTLVTTLAAPLAPADMTATLTSTVDFPSSGRLKIGTEEVTYTSITGNVVTISQRGVNGMPGSFPSGTTVSSSSVLVTDSNHGAITDSVVVFSNAVAVGGIPATALNKDHYIFFRSASQYYITLPVYPTTAATGGNTVTAMYLINPGLATTGKSEGWGAGGFGTGPYGVGVGEGAGRRLRLWSHANFGEDLVFGPKDEGIYYWDATNGIEQRGVALSSLPGAREVPLFQTQLLVTESRIVVAFGANPEGSLIQDPLLIRWADQEKPQDWASTPTNLAGDLRVTIGSRIVTAVQTRQEILVFTDSAVYSMQPLQSEEVFGITLLADNISIAGPNAVATLNNIVYWMGRDKFYQYDGRVNTLTSSVRDFVFGNINLDQVEQVYAGVNPAFNEVWWFYTDTQANQNNRYVTWNTQETAWAIGSMERTAWYYVPRLGRPVAAFGSRLLEHENGTDDLSGDFSVAIPAYIESADIDIEDGDKFGFIRRVLPDVTFVGSTSPMPQVMITLRPRNSSGGAYRQEESPLVVRGVSAPVEQFTEQIYIRARGRQMAVRIESSGLGVTWQLGMLRIDLREDGRKGG